MLLGAGNENRRKNNMPHKGKYGGRNPTKIMKAKAKKKHKK